MAIPSKYQWRVVQSGLLSGNAIWMEVREPDNTTVRGSIRFTLFQGVYLSLETNVDPLGIAVHDAGYIVSFHNDGVGRTPFPLLPGDDHFSQVIDDEILQTALGEVNQETARLYRELAGLRGTIQRLEREHAGISPDLGFRWYFASKTESGNFTEADFLAGSSSRTKQILAPAFTGSKRLAFAYPNSSPFFTGLFVDGVDVLPQFPRQLTGVSSIDGVAVRVYATTATLDEIYGNRDYFRAV